MSSINIPVSTPSVIPVPGPNTIAPPSPAAVGATIPVGPIGASSLDASQTGYSLTQQGDVDPTSLLPPDFDIQPWAPALYANCPSCGSMHDDDLYSVEPFSPAYYARPSPYDTVGGGGDFEVLPMTSYFAKAVPHGYHLPIILTGVGLLGIALYMFVRKKR